MATSFPLPKGFFDTHARISDDRRRQCIEFAESSIRKVFALSDSNKNSWIPVREKKNVAIYRNFCQTRGPKAYKSNIAEVAGKSDMNASLDEIGRAYAAHDDALFKRLMKKVNPGVMDAAVLFTIVPRTPVTPFRYIGIKWFAVKTPTPLVSHRDYCCLEVQDKIEDSYGNEMYIRVLNSIEINECPSLENSHGLVRAKVLAGYMYRADRAEKNLIRVHHVLRFDPAGYFPSQWAYKTAESQLVNSVDQIKRIIEKQQMNACTFVDKKQWVPNHERAHCAVCSRAFGTFRQRHHCRCCGEVICRKCSVFKSVDVPGTTIKNVRICSICNMGVQRSATHQDDTMSDVSASSVTSSSTIAHNEMNMMDLYLSGNPSTPSAYSCASTRSNLSIRSTSSSRSVIDARARAGNHSNSNSTPQFFKSNGPEQSIFGSARTPVEPASSENNNPRSFFNETNTPRSYIRNSLTPRSANVTPRSTMSGVDVNAMQSKINDPETPKALLERINSFKENPLDLDYLRESIKVQTGRSLSNADLPPAKIPRLEPQDVDMEDVSLSSDVNMEKEITRSAAHSNATESSSPTASATEGMGELEQETKKPMFGGLFARSFGPSTAILLPHEDEPRICSST